MALKPAKATVSIIDKATRPLRSIAKAFKGMGLSSKKANKDLNNTQKALNGLTKAQNRLNRTQAGIKRSTSGIQGQAVGVLAVGLAFKQALSPAIKFEQSMKNLEAVAFGSADATVNVSANMALLSEQAKKLGATTAFSATQAAEGQLFLAKAGFKTNQILSAMGPLLDLAAASETELGRASDITSDLLGAFGLKAKDTGKLADILAAATSSANVDMETLFETLKTAAPIGVAAGQSLEGIVTATSLLGNVGIKGSAAGTALKNSFIRLASPAAEGTKVLKELGIQTSDSAGNMLPMEKIMFNLGKAAKNLSQTKRIKAFDSVFGKRAIAGALNLEKAVNSGDFAKMLKNLKNAEGTARKMALIRMDSTQGSFVQLMSATEGIAITFGNFLTPAIRGFATILTTLSTPIQTFLKDNGDLVRTIGLFAGAMIAAKVISLAYTASLWLISPALTAMKVALGVAKIAMIAFNFAMSVSPIGLLITGITALAAGGILLAKNWDTVTATFSKLWDTIKGLGSLIGLDSLFGGGAEVTQNINPVQATNTIQQNATNNNNAIINVNVADGAVKSVETKGNFKTDVFLNNGEQS